jgi:hypothetical protein
MKPRDLFTLAVRLVGLLFLYKGVSVAADFLAVVIFGPTGGGFPWRLLGGVFYERPRRHVVLPRGLAILELGLPASQKR